MDTPERIDDEFLPATTLSNRTKLALLALGVCMLVGIVFFGVNLLQAEEKLLVCPPPYVDDQTCGESCSGTCNAALFAEGEPVCFECKEPEQPTGPTNCPNGLVNDETVCNARCGNGSCTEFTTVGSETCFICVQCPRNTFSSKEDCSTTCSSECTVDQQSQGVRCYTCPQ